MNILENKYKMEKEANIFLAKRNVVDSIWKSANLEGIAITFPETQAIYDGLNVAHLRIDEIQSINNLKHAWQFLLSSIDNEIDFNYISSVHRLVGNNIVDTPGDLRKFEVSMGWRPALPTQEYLEELLQSYKTSEGNITNSILDFMCKFMKMQPFNAGNKRTAMLLANHELIKNGCGVLSISNENKVEFGNKLISYYENEDEINNLKSFIYEKCLEGNT